MTWKAALKVPQVLNTICKRMSSYPILFAFLIVVGFVLVTYLVVGGPVFESNDDVGMLLVSAGIGYVDKPDDHVMFMHYFIGKGLSFLYGLNQTISWYALFFLLAQILSLTVIVRLLVAKGKGWAGLLIALVFFAGACIRPLVFYQFTSTAALVASSGALLLMVAAQRGQSLSYKYLVPALSLIGLGAMIRADSTKMILALLVLTLVFRFGFKSDWKKLTRGILSVIVAGGVVFALSWLNTSYYASSEWKNFYRENDYLFFIMHKKLQPFSESTISTFESVNWSPVDFQVFKHWYMLDENTFSHAKLDKVVSSISPFHSTMSLKEVYLKISSIVEDITFLPLFISIAILSVLTVQRRFSRIAALTFVSALLVFCVCILFLFHLPNRLCSSILSFAALVLLFNFSRSTASKIWMFNPLAKAVVVIGCLAVAFFVLGHYRQFVQHRYDSSLIFKKAVKNLNPNSKDLYIDLAGSVPLETVKPFDNIKSYFDSFRLVCIGGHGRSPHVKERLKQWEIKDLLKELDHDRLLLVLRDESLQGVISKYVVQHYQKLPVFQLVYKEPKVHFNVYKVSFKTLIPSGPRQDTDQSADCPNFASQDLLFWQDKPTWNTYGLKFKSKESLSLKYELFKHCPVLQYEKTLEIDPKEYSHFAIELKVDKWIAYNRKITVLYKLNNQPEERMFDIELLPDSKMHRYVFDLKKLDLGDKDRITGISVRPLAIRANPYGECFSIGKIGFLRSRADI